MSTKYNGKVAEEGPVAGGGLLAHKLEWDINRSWYKNTREELAPLLTL